MWLQGQQQLLLVEGDAGLASGRVEDFVVRSGPRAQAGLVAVRRGHGLLGVVGSPGAASLTWLFSGRGAHGFAA